MYGIERQVKVRVEPTVTETADVIWDMCSYDQLSLLSCLDMRFFQIPADGEQQLGYMRDVLLQHPPKQQEHVKHIVKAFYQYLVEDNKEDVK